MILESLFKISIAGFKKNGKLPKTVLIQHRKFKKVYSLRKVITLAFQIIDNDPTIDRSKEITPLSAIRLANNSIYRARLKSKVASYGLKGLEKTIIDLNIKSLDLTIENWNAGGIISDRAVSILKRVKRSFSYSEALYAISYFKELDIIITDNYMDSMNMQHYLAMHGISTLVVTKHIVNGKYTPHPPFLGIAYV